MLHWVHHKTHRMMEDEKMETPFCQSCGMPMETQEMYGTGADGAKTPEYCTYCYQNGAFTSDVSMEGMIEQCLPHMVSEERTEAEARAMMEAFLPTLKRWKKEA